MPSRIALALSLAFASALPVLSHAQSTRAPDDAYIAPADPSQLLKSAEERARRGRDAVVPTASGVTIPVAGFTVIPVAAGGPTVIPVTVAGARDIVGTVWLYQDGTIATVVSPDPVIARTFSPNASAGAGVPSRLDPVRRLEPSASVGASIPGSGGLYDEVIFYRTDGSVLKQNHDGSVVTLERPR